MGNTEKASKPPSPSHEGQGGGIKVDQEDAPNSRFGSGVPRWAGLLAAALAIAFISLVPNLVGDPVESEDEPKPPTVITPPQPGEEIPLLRTETSIGVVEWIKLVGDVGEIPLGDIYINPFGDGYVSYSGGNIWVSPDGDSWTISSQPSPFRDYSWVRITGRWALAYASDNQMVPLLDGFQVFQAGDHNWVPVALPEPALPEVEGMSYRGLLGQPVESGSVVVIPFSGWGTPAFEDHYGVFSVPCGDTARCSILPDAAWDPATDTLVVSFFNGYIMIEASLRMQVEDNQVVFTDVETGELIHTLIFAKATDAASYAEGLTKYQPLEISGIWVSSNKGIFTSHEVPWAGTGPMLAVPQGGFAVYAGLFSRAPGESFEQTRVWTSTDGSDWEDRGTPGFVSGPFGQAEVGEAGPNLYATLYRGDLIKHWLSTDGLTWVEGDRALPPWALIEPTEFGFAAIDFSVEDRPRFWLSADGELWESINVPTSEPALFSAKHDSGAAGELLYSATGFGRARTLWIGRLVSP